MTQGWTSKAYDEMMRKYEDILRSAKLSPHLKELEKQGYRFEPQIPNVAIYYGNGRIFVAEVNKRGVVFDYKEHIDFFKHTAEHMENVVRFRGLLKARKIPFRELHSKRLEELFPELGEVKEEQDET